MNTAGSHTVFQEISSFYCSYTSKKLCKEQDVMYSYFKRNTLCMSQCKTTTNYNKKNNS